MSANSAKACLQCFCRGGSFGSFGGSNGGSVGGVFFGRFVCKAQRKGDNEVAIFGKRSSHRTNTLPVADCAPPKKRNEDWALRTSTLGILRYFPIRMRKECHRMPDKMSEVQSVNHQNICQNVLYVRKKNIRRSVKKCQNMYENKCQVYPLSSAANLRTLRTNRSWLPG